MSTLLKFAEEARSKQNRKSDNVYSLFQTLRADQKKLTIKLTEYELEDNEIKVVIRALEAADPDKKCFRLVGGILCERTVKDVIPSLKTRKEEVTVIIANLKEELAKRATEIQDFKEKHKIRVCRADLANLKNTLPLLSGNGASGTGATSTGDTTSEISATPGAASTTDATITTTPTPSSNPSEQASVDASS